MFMQHPASRMRNGSHLGRHPADLAKYNGRLIAHYARKILEALGPDEPVPQWVEMTGALVQSDVAAAGHYIRDMLAHELKPMSSTHPMAGDARRRNYAYPIWRRMPNGGRHNYMFPWAMAQALEYGEFIARELPQDAAVDDWAEYKLSRAAGRLDDIAHYIEYRKARGEPLVPHHAPSEHEVADMQMEPVIVLVEGAGEGGMMEAEPRTANACASCMLFAVAGRKKNSCYPGASVFLDNMRWLYPPQSIPQRPGQAQTYVQGY